MKTTKQTNRRQKRRGIALIWVMLLAMVLIGFAGLLIDTARAYITAHQLHNAADAAALAGSRHVPMVMDPNYTGDSPEQVAQSYALAHTAAAIAVDLNTTRYGTVNDEISSAQPQPSDTTNPYTISGDIVIGRYIDHSRLFIVDHDTPDAMLVVARRDGTTNAELPLLFGPIFNIDTIGLKRYAIAKVIDPYGAGIIALGECPINPGDPACPGIEFDGKGTEVPLTIFNGGSLHVNSFMESTTQDGAVAINNKNIILDIERLIAVGGLNDKFYDSMDAYPDAYEDADIQSDLGEEYVEPDPYAALPDAVPGVSPDYDPNDLGTITSSGTYSPGYYSGGIQISSSDVTLLPGNYYLDSVGQNASMSMSGGTLTGEGVTLHIIGDADKGVDIRGNTYIDISSPTSGIYAGIGIFQKRNPSYDCAVSCSGVPISEFNGGGEISVDGAVYMPHNKLDLRGTGGIFITRAVADRFIIGGTGEKVINYKGEPEIAAQSYLVE
ncbi:MAG: hypothetical protein B6I25_05220 [Planctomycetales bacterium 4572_13]|nr:MAG: hypothetical protein B6I25_05220 [Planctomycetales bacterium 4572_13]